MEPGNGDVGPLVSPPLPPAITEESADAVVHRQVQQDNMWKELMVMFKDAPSENGTGDGGGGAIALREFLTAMAIAPGSNFAGKTVAQASIHKSPDLVLVSIEHACMNKEEEDSATGHRSTGDTSHSVNQISKLYCSSCCPCFLYPVRPSCILHLQPIDCLLLYLLLGIFHLFLDSCVHDQFLICILLQNVQTFHI